MAFNFTRPRFGSSKVPWFVSDELPTGGGGLEPFTGSTGAFDLTGLAAGASRNTNVPIAEAALGDAVIANVASTPHIDVFYDAWVYSPGNIRVRARNRGAAPIDAGWDQEIFVMVFPAGRSSS